MRDRRRCDRNAAHESRGSLGPVFLYDVIKTACNPQQKKKDSMIVPLFRPVVVTVATAATAAVSSFAFMDADPSLWFFDRFFCSDDRRHKYFDEKRIWITGASSGIGRELAHQLASHNAQLVLSGRSHERLQQVANECNNIILQNNNNNKENDVINNAVQIEPFDVLQTEEIDRIVDRVGHCDCVILNAGEGHLSTSTTTPLEQTERLFQVNTMSTIRLVQTLLRKQRPRVPNQQKDTSLLSSQQQQQDEKLQLVVTLSVAAKFGVPLLSSYAAAKHALRGYFVSLACERSDDVRVDLPCPGPVDTGFVLAKSSSSSSNLKLTPQRCARLMISSMVRPGIGGETWIAKQPTLLFCLLQQYAPALANYLLLRKMGPLRVAIYEAGLDLYDPKSIQQLREMQKKDQD